MQNKHRSPGHVSACAGGTHSYIHTPSVSKDKQECCVMFSTTLSFLQTAVEKKPQHNRAAALVTLEGRADNGRMLSHAPPTRGHRPVSPRWRTIPLEEQRGVIGETLS